MPRDPACRNCAEKKVGCKPIPGHSACQRCIGRNLRCEWPQPTTPVIAVPGTYITSCERCRLKRIKCERQSPASPTCFACVSKGEPCSLGTPGNTGNPPHSAPPVVNSVPASPNPQAGGTLGGSTSRATSEPATQSRHSTWWDVVLAPSPR
ncbi:hypothetical protein C8Q77DRAFT_700008 [Trametes polyzona]|nr:hypothetical protein C8Q77DRAFT_700008 [Trametes polyzona]